MSQESYPHMEFPFWTPRPVSETLEIYAKWAASYDDDLKVAGYHTPRRLSLALKEFVSENAKILDFGCGTGLSGKALIEARFSNLHGTDISPDMLDLAVGSGHYARLWQETPGELNGVEPGQYDVIVAAGVVSLGAAPPETLTLLIDKLSKDGLIAFSFNDPTIEIGTYDAVLSKEIDDGRIEVVLREYGEHLTGKNMGSDVIIAKRL